LLRRPYQALRLVARRTFWYRTTLEPLIELDGANSDLPGQIPEWQVVALKGEQHLAMKLAIGRQSSCDLRAPAAGRLTTQCALVGGSGARADFEVRATIDGDTFVRSCITESGAGWVPFVLPFRPRRPGARVTITFGSTAGGDSSGACAVWGSPTIEWRKSIGEIRQSLWRSLRQHGVAGLLNRLRAHRSTAPEASLESYHTWLAAHTPDGATLARLRGNSAPRKQPCVAVLVIGNRNQAAVSRTLASLDRQVHSGWEAWICSSGAATDSQFDAVTSLDGSTRVRAISAATNADALNAACAGSSAELVAVVDAGDELTADAVHALSECVARYPDSDLVYSDEDLASPEGPRAPSFKPGWSPEFLLSRMYPGRLLTIRRSLLQEIGGYRHEADGALEYDVMLRAVARSDRVQHVPKILYRAAAPRMTVAVSERRALEDFCRQTGREATVLPGSAPGTWRLRHHVSARPQVTIVIPTHAAPGRTAEGLQPLITQCLRSIIGRTSHRPYDVVIADDGHLPDAAAALLAQVPHRRVTYTSAGPFNYSRKINFAVGHAEGEYVLLLNDDIEVINADWLTSMLEYAQQKEIGAVGAKLFYPDGRLQHVGVATGVGGIAAHLLHQHPGGTTGCGNIAVAVRNCSAVTAACLLTRRDIYNQVGGFDERLAIEFNDVDFCLRLRAAGYRIVFTPYARLYHYESASFGSRVQNRQDVEQMRQIWGAALGEDPYYNPNLSREFSDCRLPPARDVAID
jgi:GT2 family glycosyltransferase